MFDKELRPGWSIVAAAKNRAKPMTYSLATWIDTEASQIILVDWDSDVSLEKALAEMEVFQYPNNRIVHVHVEDEPYWEPSTAWNVGMLFVNHERMVKLDADVCIVQRELLSCDPGCFKANNWREETQANRSYLTGSFSAWSQDVFDVGCYDERLTVGYGAEDDALYDCLEASGVLRQSFDTGTLLHLPHRDSQRYENYKDTTPSPEPAQERRKGNEPWSAAMALSRGARFDIELIGENRYRAKRRAKNSNPSTA